MADFIFMTALGIIFVALLLTLLRFILGPTVVDRVIAFDVLTIISIPLMGLVAHVAARAIYIDAALIYALLSFLGVLVVARYLERGL